MSQPMRIDAPWLLDDKVLKLVEALGRDNMRFVGGVVRDTILARDVGDVDVATLLTPDEVTRCLKAAGLKAVPTGVEHGTITAVVDGTPYEVTTLRHDVETHGRHADVAFHDNWEEDAARRDFTMNAMYLTADGRLYDYFGGQGDIKAGAVRFIGEAKTRIEEDALRIMRFFRFHAHYGQSALDSDGLAACRNAVDHLDHLSVERVRVELIKLLAATDPLPVLKAMDEVGVLAHVLPECQSLERIEKLVQAELAAEEPPYALRRFSTLLPTRHGAVREAARRLKFSNDARNKLESLVHIDPDVRPGMDAHVMREALYRYGMETFKNFAWLNVDLVHAKVMPALFRHAESWTIPEMPVSGKDLLALGVPSGPEVGVLLCRMEEAWIESDFTMPREVLLQHFLEE